MTTRKEHQSSTGTQPNRARNRSWVRWVLLFAFGLLVGAVLFGGGNSKPDPQDHAQSDASQSVDVWTCSMHPQVQSPEPGKCPICFMDLIPVAGDSGNESDTQLTMSESAMRLAEVMTVPVARSKAESDVRTVGKVLVDERRLRRLTAWVDGRLDRLFVDYTGVNVALGDHLVEIYSPELYSAQVELIESIKTQNDLAKSKVEFLRHSAETTVGAAREKLRLLGLQPQQIQEIEESGRAKEHVTLYAPMAGVVIHKAAVEGEYVKTGSPIYTIADLSQVWVVLDVYESDLVWIRYGQNVSFEVEAFPGEGFVGQIAFIDPVVNPVTRTVKVRVNVANPDLRLKPDMFVRAVIRSQILGDGRSQNPDLAGKWVSPMHPEIVKDHPGSCDICGMPLVPAEELGLVPETANPEDPLIIPETAPLITGKRAIVYVRLPDRTRPTFEGREIVLGPKVGNHYIVKQGLVEGELVVMNGSFKIDSAMQIQAKPSMMSPERGAPAPEHQHLEHTPDSFRDSLAPAFSSYFSLQTALANDDLESANIESKIMAQALARAIVSDLKATTKEAWVQVGGELDTLLQECSSAGDLEQARSAFAKISTILISLDQSNGPPSEQTHTLMYCPMAFGNQGAYWLQDHSQVQNPFFGESMKRCGEVKGSFPPVLEESKQ